MTGDTRSRPRTVVLTGASSGIGEAAAHSLAAHGIRVFILGRDSSRTQQVAEQVGGIPVVVDYDSLLDVRKAATYLLETAGPIDVLVNNAGSLRPERLVTVDGHEENWQRNYLAPFLLTGLLLPRLVETANQESDARVIWTVERRARPHLLRMDDLHWEERPLATGSKSYYAAKTAASLAHEELTRQLVGTSVRSYAFYPGRTRTRLTRDTPSPWGKITAPRRTAQQSAMQLHSLAAPPALPIPSGTFFDGSTARPYPGFPVEHATWSHVLWESTARALRLN